jgi:predicted outer membrane repeat protein
MKKLLLSLLLLTSPLIWATDILVGPASDADCQFNSIQAAVDSGNTDMRIYVSNQLNTNTGVFINNKAVLGLYGGFDNCADAATTTYNSMVATAISNAGNSALSVSETRAGFSSTIEINGFDLINSDMGLSAGNGASTVAFVVNITDVNIYGNRIGINVNVGSSDVTVVNFNQGGIYNNINNNNGGGIFCVNATVNLGNVVSIHDNSATNGGGIYARNCIVSLQSGDNLLIDNTALGVFKNTASENGGGLFLSQSQFTATGNSVFLASISFNQAPTVGYGGGLYIDSGSVVDLKHTRLYGNSAAQRGGGIYMKHSNNTYAQPVLTMQRDTFNCTIGSSHICSVFSFNKASADDGKGGAIYLDSNTQANIYQTELNSNEATNAAVFYLEQNSTLDLEGDLIINNHLKDMTINPQDSSILFANNLSNVAINFTTFADNFVNNLFRVVASNTFNLDNSIVSHNAEIFKTFGTLNYDNVMVSCSLYTFSPDSFHSNFFDMTSFFSADPQFVSANDYSLQSTSPALNANCSSAIPANFTDIVDYNRLSDGIADLGAYERVVDNLVFSDGFEN